MGIKEFTGNECGFDENQADNASGCEVGIELCNSMNSVVGLGYFASATK